MREGVACQWIRTTGELERFVPQWSGLWRQDSHATPFQSPEWLVPWWHSFGQDDLRAVAILQNGTVTGLLPFYVYREPQSGELQLLLLGVGTTDYLDGVFAGNCTVEDIENALHFLCAEDGWDALYVSQLRPGSKLFRAFEKFMRDGVRRSEAQSCSRMPALSMAELPQKIRRNAMYYRNRAMRVGKLDLAVADASNWAEMFETLCDLHTKRWQTRGEGGVLADPRVVAWHREALPLLERAGLLRLCSLRLNVEPIGILYSLVDPPWRSERVQFFYLPGFSIEHAELRPGTLLTALAIDDAAREGVRTIDMLRGDEEYKKIWHTHRVPTFGFALYRDARQRIVAEAGGVAA